MTTQKSLWDLIPKETVKHFPRTTHKLFAGDRRVPGEIVRAVLGLADEDRLTESVVFMWTDKVYDSTSFVVVVVAGRAVVVLEGQDAVVEEHLSVKFARDEMFWGGDVPLRLAGTFRSGRKKG